MSTNRKDSDLKGHEVVPKSGRENLLDQVLDHLTPEEKRSLTVKAVERRLDLDEQAKKAELRHQASSADMANTVRQVEAIEKSTKSDYTIDANYETASGRTSVKIRKTNNTAIIIIVIVIGVVALFLLAK
jgi:aspartate aminotransferase-like enzyme